MLAGPAPKFSRSRRVRRLFPQVPDRGFASMATATAHETHGADLTNIRDELVALREMVAKVDHAQDALLVNGNSLWDKSKPCQG
jgi:hypothetical protein